MRVEDLNWMDVDKYLKHDDRLILVIGSTEQHGYLSLLTDVKIPQALADAASKQTGVLVAPSLNFGCSPYFLKYPGTFSLRVSTLIAAVQDILCSAHGHGFRRILVLNGHGGNSPARVQCHEIINNLPDLRLAWYDWWTANSILAVAEKHQIKPSHANWLEAFPFTIVSELPAEEKVPRCVAGILDAQAARRVYGDGSFGGRYQVEADIMQEVFDTALQDILQMLKFE